LGEEFIEPFRVVEQGEVFANLGHVELSALRSQQRPDIVEATGAGWIVYQRPQLEANQPFCADHPQGTERRGALLASPSRRLAIGR